MDEKLSRRLALELLSAESAEDVKKVLNESEASYYFDTAANWSPYGNREKNWDTVGNQQTNPVPCCSSTAFRTAKNRSFALMEKPFEFWI